MLPHGADRSGGDVRVKLLRRFGDAEICELCHVELVQQHIGWLDVPMNHWRILQHHTIL